MIQLFGADRDSRNDERRRTDVKVVTIGAQTIHKTMTTVTTHTHAVSNNLMSRLVRKVQTSLRRLTEHNNKTGGERRPINIY